MFEVMWLPSARDDLASLWVAADSEGRAEITAATNAIDQGLRRDPFADSESREGPARILFVYPLAIRFEVDAEERRVWVVAVWRFGRRGA